MVRRSQALNFNDELFDLPNQIKLLMPQLFSNAFGTRNKMTEQDLKKYIDTDGRKGITMIKNDTSDLESSPSFCTEEHNGEGLYLGDSFTLTSEQSSVSQFGS